MPTLPTCYLKWRENHSLTKLSSRTDPVFFALNLSQGVKKSWKLAPHVLGPGMMRNLWFRPHLREKNMFHDRFFQNISYLQTSEALPGRSSSFWIPISTAPKRGFFQACVLKYGVFHHQRHPSSSSVAVKLCLALHPEVLGFNWDADILCRWWFLSQILWDYVWCCWLSGGLSMVGFSMVYVTLNCNPFALENDFT